mmetsp:Transcript_40237/g.105655  ORF Transcript_40237/g.105655 Transcript_40237/m.105655 type:complete len:162 (-) Transcript_40237:30-515(-)
MAVKNHQEYCRLHGYHWDEVDARGRGEVALDEWLAPSLPPLGSGWVLWLGCDVMITDAARTLDSIMGKYINDVKSDNVCALSTASPAGVSTSAVLMKSQSSDRCHTRGLVLVENGDLGSPSTPDGLSQVRWRPGDFLRHHNCSQSCLTEMQDAQVAFRESR